MWGPLPHLENQGSDRRWTAAKRKGPARGVNSRNLKPIGQIVSEIRRFEKWQKVKIGSYLQWESADTLGTQHRQNFEAPYLVNGRG
jgi:hypothetical protein